jgi:hypothetical protein
MGNDALTELSRVAHLLTEEERATAELLLKPTVRDFLRTLPDDVLEVSFAAAQAAEAAGRVKWPDVIAFLPDDLRERFAIGLSRGYW